MPEFIGRLPVVSVLEELTEDDLARILVEPENALVKQYQKLFAVDGVTLTFTEGAIRQIAATSIRRGTGARGLRSIIEKTLEDTMFRLPSMEGVEEVVVDEPPVTGSGTRNYSKVSTRRKFLVYVRRKAENSCDTPRFCLGVHFRVYLIRVAETEDNVARSGQRIGEQLTTDQQVRFESCSRNSHQSSGGAKK